MGPIWIVTSSKDLDIRMIIKQTPKMELKKIGNRILGGVVCPIKLRIPRGEAEACCFLPFTCYK